MAASLAGDMRGTASPGELGLGLLPAIKRRAASSNQRSLKGSTLGRGYCLALILGDFPRQEAGGFDRGTPPVGRVKTGEEIYT